MPYCIGFLSFTAIKPIIPRLNAATSPSDLFRLACPLQTGRRKDLQHIAISVLLAAIVLALASLGAIWLFMQQSVLRHDGTIVPRGTPPDAVTAKEAELTFTNYLRDVFWFLAPNEPWCEACKKVVADEEVHCHERQCPSAFSGSAKLPNLSPAL
jgi:hypothetical protein